MRKFDLFVLRSGINSVADVPRSTEISFTKFTFKVSVYVSKKTISTDFVPLNNKVNPTTQCNALKK